MRLKVEDVRTQVVVNKKTTRSPLSWNKFELDTLIRTKENISVWFLLILLL